jgi:hypothetical protein
MRKQRNRPSWWLLYLLGLGVIGLLVLGARASMSERGHEAAAIGTVLLAGGLTEVWLRANRRALLHVEGMLLVRQTRPYVAQDALPREETQPAPGCRLQPAEGTARPTAQPTAPATSILPSPEAGRQKTMAR